MQLHLDEIATKVTPGAHAILLLDQAGWHGAKILKVPSNITLMPLPPRAPELNGQENIWQFMRQNWLSNRIFKSFDDIVDHCCYAWNTLIDQPWKIMSIAHREMGSHRSPIVTIGITHCMSCLRLRTRAGLRGQHDRHAGGAGRDRCYRSHEGRSLLRGWTARPRQHHASST
jgi:hypothetical protein